MEILFVDMKLCRWPCNPSLPQFSVSVSLCAEAPGDLPVLLPWIPALGDFPDGSSDSLHT